MKRTAILLLTALLAGCDVGVTSQKPLFAASGGQPADGLWALLPADCQAPASASMSSWPECAMPVWLSRGTATVFYTGTPVHLRFVMADGTPHVVQGAGIVPPHEQTGEGPQTAIMYWAFDPEGAAPYRRGKAWPLACPTAPVPGITSDPGEKTSCTADSADAVRRLAGSVPDPTSVRTAVWVAAAD